MRYVEYYRKENDEYIADCGDRSIMILDKRNSITTSKLDAIKFNGYRRPIYDAYALFEGDNIIRSHSITNIIKL